MYSYTHTLLIYPQNWIFSRSFLGVVHKFCQEKKYPKVLVMWCKPQNGLSAILMVKKAAVPGYNPLPARLTIDEVLVCGQSFIQLPELYGGVLPGRHHSFVRAGLSGGKTAPVATGIESGRFIPCCCAGILNDGWPVTPSTTIAFKRLTARS